MNTTILDRQSLFDLALQLHGDISTVFALAEANDLSVSDDLTVEQALQYNDTDTANRIVTTQYGNQHHTPATALSSEITAGDNAFLLEGIEYWGIQYDFVIS